MKTWSMPVCDGKSNFLPCNLCGATIFKPALQCERFSFVRCAKCSLVLRNPCLTKEEIISRYSKIYGDDYLSYELANEEAFLRLQQLALKDAGFTKLEKKLFTSSSALGTQDVPSVLDIGCATGTMLAFLRRCGWRVTGVEISPCAAYAQKERGLNVSNLTLEENNFNENSFDVVLASHLIEHLNDPFALLKETHRILKKDGRVFITTPNIESFQSWLYGSRWRSAIFDHLFLFSIQTLKKMLVKTGFKIESCHTWGGLAAGTSPKWLKKIADVLVKKLGCGDVMIIRAKK